jgi:hypothetical protein
MKRFIWAMSAALMLAACGEHEMTGELTTGMTPTDSVKKKTITFDFGEISQQAMTRATLAELNITDLWLFDYMGDDLKQTIHKTDGFDAASLSLDYGEHTLCFVASRGSEPTVTAPTISWVKPSDTFWATLPLNVQPASSASQSVTLHRVATRLRISITDEITSQMVRLEVEPATWYYGMNIRTGDGTDARQQMRSVAIPSSYIGTTGQVSALFFGLSPSTDWRTDIDVKMIGTDESVLGHVTLPSARFAQNLTTVYSGGIIGAGKSVTITADDNWSDDNVQTW